jgi:cytochrome c oxidase subunit 4
VLKATLVVLYFMHVRYSSRLTWVFVLAGLFWLLILMTMTLTDYQTRGGL